MLATCLPASRRERKGFKREGAGEPDGCLAPQRTQRIQTQRREGRRERKGFLFFAPFASFRGYSPAVPSVVKKRTPSPDQPITGMIDPKCTYPSSLCALLINNLRALCALCAFALKTSRLCSLCVFVLTVFTFEVSYV